jgi:hypothetical protein
MDIESQACNFREERAAVCAANIGVINRREYQLDRYR